METITVHEGVRLRTKVTKKIDFDFAEVGQRKCGSLSLMTCYRLSTEREGTGGISLCAGHVKPRVRHMIGRRRRATQWVQGGAEVRVKPGRRHRQP